MGVLRGPTPRQQRLIDIEQAIRELSNYSDAAYFTMASHLHEVKRDMLAGENADDFKGWIANQKFPSGSSTPLDWVTKAIDVYEVFMLNLQMPVDELVEMGRAKLYVLSPLVKSGGYTQTLWNQAKAWRTRDLRQAIRETRSSTKGQGLPYLASCPNCGERFQIWGVTRSRSG